MKPPLGFWAMVLVVVLRAWSVAPTLIARKPGAARVTVAAIVLVLYVVTTVATTRRVRAADPASAANFVWMMGAAGLALAVAILMLM